MSSYQSADPLTHDDWQHLAVTIDGSQGTLEFFINNEPAGRHNIPSVVLAPNPNDLLIGKNDSAEYFHGTMDDVRVYSRVLNRDEITSVFRYSSDSHLIAKYDFERYDTEEGKLFDEGPNGYEGAFVNVQHVSDVLRTEQGEAAITRTAFRTETTEFVEIPADGDNKLQGDHLSTCTFAAWVKLSSGTEDTFEPVIAKNGVFRFGVRNRKACLELGDGTAMHALPAFSPMSDAAASSTEARSSDVADASPESSLRGSPAPRPDSNGFARRIGANTLVWRFEGDLRDDSSVFPFRTVDCESRTKNVFQIDSPYGLASASHAFFDADTALRVSNWNLTNNAGAYWYLRTGMDAAPLPQWTEGEMPITLAARFKFLDGADLTTTAVGMILGSGAADQGYKLQNWDNAAQPNYHVAVQLWGTGADTFGITCNAFSGQGNSGNVVSATFAGKREHVHANGWNYLFLMHAPSDGTTVAYINTVKAAEADGTVALPGVFERNLRVGPYAPNLERFTNKGVLLDSVEMVDAVLDAPMCAFYISGRFETQEGASAIPENMLRAHYLFDDPGAIGTATTGAHDATVHGAPNVESSLVEGSYAIRADEAGHVSIPGLVLRTDKIFSFGAWVKPSSVQGFHPIVTRTQGENTLAFGIRDGDLEVSVQSDAPPTVRDLRATLQYDPTSDSRVVSVEGSVEDVSGGDAYVAVFAREYSSVMHAAVGESVKALALDASVKRFALSAGGTTVDIASTFDRYVYDVEASSSRPLDGFYEFFVVVYAEDAQGRATVRSAPCDVVPTGDVAVQPVVQKRTILLDDGHEYLVDTIAGADADSDRTPWYLVMNYLHDAGDTTPAVARTLVGRSENEGFPIQRQHFLTHSWNNAPAGGYAESPSSLAKNAALSGPWGHASPDLFDKLLTAIGDHGVELAFRASTDRHPRVMNFTTDWRWLVDYYRDGFNPKPSGSFGTSWTPEAGHTTNLPETVTDLNVNHYANAMARNPFFSNSHKNYMGAESSGYWSVDEGAGNHAVFSQVWVRGRKGLAGRPAPMRLTGNDARNHQRSPGTFSKGATYFVTLLNDDVVHHDSFETNKSSIANLFNHCTTDVNFNGYGHGAEWRAAYTFAAGPVEATHMLFYQATSHQTRSVTVFHCSDPALPLDDPKGWTKLGEGAFETNADYTQLRIDFPLTKASRFMIHATAWTSSTTKFALKEWMIFGYQIDKFDTIRGQISDASDKNRPHNTAPAQHVVLSSPGAVDGSERAMCNLPTTDAYNTLFLDKLRAHTGNPTIGWNGNDRVVKAALNNGDLVYYDCHQTYVQNAGWHGYDAVNVFAREHVVNRFRTGTYGADQTWGWMFPRSATTTFKRSARLIYQFRRSKKLRAVRIMGHHSYKMSAEVVLYTRNADGDFARFKTIGTTARLEKDQFELFELGDAVPEDTTFMIEFLCQETGDTGIGALEFVGDAAGGNKGADRTGFRAASLRVERVEGDVVANFDYSHAHTSPVTTYLAAYTYAREGAAFEIAHAQSFTLPPSNDGSFQTTLSHAYGPDGAHVALDAVNYLEVYGMVSDPAVGMYRVLPPAAMQPTSGKTPFGRIRSLEYDPFDNVVRARFSAFSAYEPLLSARVFLSPKPLHKIARDTLITLVEGIGTSDALQEALAGVVPRYAVTEADITLGFALDGLDDGAPQAVPAVDGALYYMGILLIDAAGSKELVVRPIPVKGTYRPIISAWGAGYDQHHELATGSTTDRRSWTEAHAIKNWMANHGHLKVRELFTMHHTGFFWAIDNNDLDHFYGWGYNAHGEIPFSNANGGNGTGTQTTVVECDRINTELRRLGLSVVAVSAAQHAAYLLLSDGRVYGWGRNTSNLLGGHSADNSTYNDLTVVDYVDDLLEKEGATVVDIGTCDYTLFVYLSNNKVFYMGNNGSGRVGDGHSTDSVGVFSPCVTLNAKLESGYHVDAICGRMSTIAWRLIPQGGDRTQEEWWGAGASRSSYNGGWTGGATSTLKRCDYLETTLQTFPDPLQYALAKGPTNWENWALIDIVSQDYYFMGHGNHMHQSDTGPWVKNEGYNPASRPYESVWASMTGHGVMIGLSATSQSDALPFYDTRSILTSSDIRTKIGGTTWEVGRGILLDAVVRPAKTAAPTHWALMATTEAGYTREQAIAYMMDPTNADNITVGTVAFGDTRDFVQEPIERMTGPSGNLGHSMSFPGGVVHLYAWTEDGDHRAYTNVSVTTPQPRIAAVTNADFNPYSDTIGARLTLFDKEHAPTKYYAALTETGTVSADMDDAAVMTAVVAASRMVPEASVLDENLQSTYADRLFVPPKAVLPKALRGLFPEVDTDAYRQLRDGDAVTVVSSNDSANGAAPSTTSFTVPWYMRQNQLQSGQSITQWTLANGDRVFTNGTGKNVFNGDTSASRVHFPHMYNYTSTFNVNGTDHTTVYHFRFFYEFAEETTINSFKLFNDTSSGCQYIRHISVYDSDSRYFAPLTLEDVGGTPYVGDVPCFAGSTITDEVDVDVRFAPVTVGPGRPIMVHLGRKSDANLYLYELQFRYVVPPTHVPTHFKHLKITAKNDAAAELVAMGTVEVDHMQVVSASCSALGEDDVIPVLGAPGTFVVDGTAATAARFDAVDLAQGDADRAVVAFVKAQAGVAGTVVGMGQMRQDRAFNLKVTAEGKMRFQAFGMDYDSDAVVADGQEHCVALVYQAATRTLLGYVDPHMDTSAPAWTFAVPRPLSTKGSSVWIGRDPLYSSFAPNAVILREGFVYETADGQTNPEYDYRTGELQIVNNAAPASKTFGMNGAPLWVVPDGFAFDESDEFYYPKGRKEPPACLKQYVPLSVEMATLRVSPGGSYHTVLTLNCQKMHTPKDVVFEVTLEESADEGATWTYVPGTKTWFGVAAHIQDTTVVNGVFDFGTNALVRPVITFLEDTGVASGYNFTWQPCISSINFVMREPDAAFAFARFGLSEMRADRTETYNAVTDPVSGQSIVLSPWSTTAANQYTLKGDFRTEDAVVSDPSEISVDGTVTIHKPGSYAVQVHTTTARQANSASSSDIPLLLLKRVPKAAGGFDEYRIKLEAGSKGQGGSPEPNFVNQYTEAMVRVDTPGTQFVLFLVWHEGHMNTTYKGNYHRHVRSTMTVLESTGDVDQLFMGPKAVTHGTGKTYGNLLRDNLLKQFTFGVTDPTNIPFYRDPNFTTGNVTLRDAKDGTTFTGTDNTADVATVVQIEVDGTYDFTFNLPELSSSVHGIMLLVNGDVEQTLAQYYGGMATRSTTYVLQGLPTHTWRGIALVAGDIVQVRYVFQHEHTNQGDVNITAAHTAWDEAAQTSKMNGALLVKRVGDASTYRTMPFRPTIHNTVEPFAFPAIDYPEVVSSANPPEILDGEVRNVAVYKERLLEANVAEYASFYGAVSNRNSPLVMRSVVKDTVRLLFEEGAPHVAKVDGSTMDILVEYHTGLPSAFDVRLLPASGAAAPWSGADFYLSRDGEEWTLSGSWTRPATFNAPVAVGQVVLPTAVPVVDTTYDVLVVMENTQGTRVLGRYVPPQIPKQLTFRTVFGIGNNTNGQLGMEGAGSTTPFDLATKINDFMAARPGAQIFAIYGAHYFAFLDVREGGQQTIYGLGSNNYNQLGCSAGGQPYTELTVCDKIMAKAAEYGPVKQIAGGVYHSMVLFENGKCWAWGYNAYSQLAENTTGDSGVNGKDPTHITGRTPKPVMIACCGYNSVVYYEDKKVYFYGRWNGHGQYGRGNTSEHNSSPLHVSQIDTHLSGNKRMVEMKGQYGAIMYGILNEDDGRITWYTAGQNHTGGSGYSSNAQVTTIVEADTLNNFLDAQGMRTYADGFVEMSGGMASYWHILRDTRDDTLWGIGSLSSGLTGVANSSSYVRLETLTDGLAGAGATMVRVVDNMYGVFVGAYLEGEMPGVVYLEEPKVAINTLRASAPSVTYDKEGAPTLQTTIAGSKIADTRYYVLATTAIDELAVAFKTEGDAAANATLSGVIAQGDGSTVTAALTHVRSPTGALVPIGALRHLRLKVYVTDGTHEDYASVAQQPSFRGPNVSVQRAGFSRITDKYDVRVAVSAPTVAITKLWAGLVHPDADPELEIGGPSPYPSILADKQVASDVGVREFTALADVSTVPTAPRTLASKDGVFEWSMDEQARQALTLHTKFSTGHLTLKTTETEQPASTYWKMQIYDIKGGHGDYATFTQMYLTDDGGARPTNKHGHGGTAIYDGIGETNANVYRYNHGWHITHQYDSPMTPTTFVWAHKHTTDTSSTLGRVPTRMRVWWSSNGTNGSWVEWGDVRLTPTVSPGGPLFQHLDFVLHPNGHPRVVTVRAPTATPAQAAIAAVVTKEGARLLENGAVVADTDKAMKLDGTSRKAIQVHSEGGVTLYDGEVPQSFLEHRAMRTDAAFIETFTSKVAPTTTNVGAGTSAELTIGFTTASTDYTHATGATLVPDVSYTVVLVAEDAAGARTLHVEPMTPSAKVPLITHLWSSGHNSDYMMGHTTAHNGNPDFYDTTFVLNYLAANPDHTLVKLECGGYTSVVLVDVGGGELRVFGFGQNAQYQLGTNNNSRVDNTMKESILYTQYAQANDTRIKTLRASWYASGVLFENGVIMCTGNAGKFMANDNNTGTAHNTLREATYVQSYCAANACEVVDFVYTNDAIFVLFSNGRLGGNGRAVGDNTNVADFKEVTLMERLDGELVDYEVTLIRGMYNSAIVRLTHKTDKTEQWWMTGENNSNGAGAAANQTYYTDWTRCTKLEELLATFSDPLNYTYVRGGLHRGASVVVDNSTDKVYRIGNFDHIPQMASATGDFVEQTTYINKAWLETNGDLARLTNFTPTVWHFNGYGIFVGGHLLGESPQTYSVGGSDKYVASDLAIDDSTLEFVTASTTVYDAATRVWVAGHNSNNMLGTTRNSNYSGWGFADVVETFLVANPTYKLLDMWSHYASVLLLEIDGKLRLYGTGANTHNTLGLNHTTTPISTPESCERFNAYADENHTAIKRVRLHANSMSVLYENGKIMSSGYNAGSFLDGTDTNSGSTLVEALLVTQYCEAKNTEVVDFDITNTDACVLFETGKVLGNGAAMGQTTNNNDALLHETALNGIMGGDYRCTLMRSMGSGSGYVFRITHKTTGEEQWWGTGNHGDNNVCGGGGDKTTYTNEMGRMNKLEALLQSFADPRDYYYVEDSHFGATVVRDNATMKWYRIGHFYHITEWSNYQTTFVETTDYITESWLETDSSAGFTPIKWKFGYYGFVILGVDLDSVASTFETRPAYDGYVRRLTTTLSGVGAGASLYAYATTQTAGVGASEMRGYAATGDPKVVRLEAASDGAVKVDLQQVVDGAGELGPASAAPEVGVVVYVVNEDGGEDLHVLSPTAAEGYVAGTPYPSITSAFFDAASGQLKVSAAVYDAFDEYHLLAFLGEPTEGSDPLALPAGATPVSATNASKAIKELALTLSEVYDSDAFDSTAALASGQTMTVRLVAVVDGAAVAHADLAHTNHKFVEVASAAFEESGELSVAFELAADMPSGLTTVVVASETALTHTEVLASKSDANVAFAPSDAIARVVTANHPDGFVPVDATSAVHVYVVVFKNDTELHYLHTQASRPESRALVQAPKFDRETGVYTGTKVAYPLVSNSEVLTFAMILDDPEARSWSLNVGAAGGKYVFGGDVTGEQPTLRVQIGDSMLFDVNAVGHPFWLKSVDVAGTSDALEGVTNNGLDKALVAWSPSAKGTYYYRCEYHASMRGVIEVTDRVSKDTLDATRVDQLIAGAGSSATVDLDSVATANALFVGDGFALTEGLTPGGDSVALAGKTQLAYVTAVRTPTDEVYGAARILLSEQAVRGDDFSYTVQDGHGRLHTRSATAFYVDSTAGGWRWIQWDFMTNVGLGRTMEWSTDRHTAHRYEPFSFFDKVSPSNGQGLMDFYLSLHPSDLDLGGAYWSQSDLAANLEFGPNYGLNATTNARISAKGERTAFPAAGLRHRIEVIEHETDADAYDLMYTMRELDTDDLIFRARFSYLQHEGTTFGTPSGGPRGIPKTCETLQIRYTPYSGSYPAIEIFDVISLESGQELVPYARLR